MHLDRRALQPSAAKSRYAGWWFGAAAATVMSVLIATQNYLALREMGRPRGWLELLSLELPVWFVWLAAAPVVFAVSRRFPLTEENRWRNLGVQLVAGAAVSFATLVAITVWKWPVLAPRLPPGMGFATSVLLEYRRMFAILMMVYFGIVAVHHALTYQRESERRTLREAQLQPVAEIDWIEADGKYVKVHVGPKQHVIRETMTQLAEVLDPERFLRISRSAIVNVDRIREIQPWFRGDHVVIMKNGAEVTSTRGFRDCLKELLDGGR